MIRAGAVAKPGTISMTGAKKGAARKSTPVTIAANPVLAPAEIPDADSM